MQKEKYNIILALIIILQLGYTTYVFACQREGAFSDEIWSYGLANSYDRPFLDLRDGVWSENVTMQDFRNINEWMSGKEFHDYITVQRGGSLLTLLSTITRR